MAEHAKRRLSRQDWIEAAIVLGAEVGFDRIAVDALAPRLGATRGSFYWHFADRAALIDAVLEVWEQQATAAVISALDGRSAEEALEQVVAAAFGASDAEDEAEWRLIGAGDDPQIGPVVARVHRRRIEFLHELLLRRGVAVAAASERARAAYAAYLGSLALRQFEPEGPDITSTLVWLLVGGAESEGPRAGENSEPAAPSLGD